MRVTLCPRGRGPGIRWDVLEARLRYGCLLSLDIRMNNERTPVSYRRDYINNGVVHLTPIELDAA